MLCLFASFRLRDSLEMDCETSSNLAAATLSSSQSKGVNKCVPVYTPHHTAPMLALIGNRLVVARGSLSGGDDYVVEEHEEADGTVCMYPRSTPKSTIDHIQNRLTGRVGVGCVETGGVRRLFDLYGFSNSLNNRSWMPFPFSMCSMSNPAQPPIDPNQSVLVIVPVSTLRLFWHS